MGMSTKVFKYEIGITDEQNVDMPLGAEILCVQMQGDTPCLWARVTEGNGTESRRIFIHGTGHPVDDDAARYVGTFQTHKRGAHVPLVFHVFEG